ncbi:MAG: hypothetical protein HOP11_06050 [Saprospiraceae bacterium]|nr:hypothetical protein [Saprospiraceae bacterium]
MSLFFVQNFIYSQADTCVHLDFEAVSGNKGEEICIKVRVSNFKDIIGFQFPINFDPRVVIPTGVNSLNPNLVGFTDSGINMDTLKGAIRVIWTNPNNDTSSLADGSILFIVCFKLIGAPGECSKIIFSDRPLITEFIKRFPIDDDREVCVIDDNPNDEVCIGQPNDLCVISTVCGTTTNTGTITIKAWGGREPYRVESQNTSPVTNTIINNKGDCLIINNQTPGVYNFKVTDGLGKDTMFTVFIQSKSSISILNNSGYTLDPTCWYTNNGRIGITVNGGSGTTFIKWLPINVYGNTNINGLKAGKYTVEASDSTGCVVSKEFTLRADSLYAEITIDKPASCAGKCDGIVTVKAFGGTPNLGGRYEYVWNRNVWNDCQSAVTCTIDSVCGDMFVVIRDRNRCEDTIHFSIPNGTELKNQISIDSIKCIGDSATINASLFTSGTLNTPITFDLRDITNTSIPGGTTNGSDYKSKLIPSGRYYLYTRDNLGCEIIDTILIIPPSRLSLLENQIDTIESCTPGGDALIDVRGVDGTAPYSYSWSNGSMTNRVDTFSAGTYTVTVTDFNKCTTSKSYTITKPVGPMITGINVTDIPCIGDKSGCVEVLFVQGNTPVTIKWSVPGNTAKICNLDTGTYTLILTDQSGCADTTSAMIKVGNGGVIIDSTVVMNPSCPGKSDGLIIVFARGGSGQLSYTWSNNASSPVNASLKAGTYIVSVDDIGGCPPVRDTFTLVERARPSVSVKNLVGISCAETSSCDASAVVTINTPDSIVVATWSSGEQFRYTSNTGTLLDTARNLCSGQQYVIISVNDLCSDTFYFNIPVPPRITLDTPKLVLIKPSCFGRLDGSITVAAKGACTPVTYEWINPVSLGPTITNLGDGYYKVKITDCRGCVHFDSIRLRQPDTIRVQVIGGSSFDVSCPGQKDGKVTIAWNGGSGGKGTFNWTPNAGKDSVLVDLLAGTYIVTVTDKNNCTGIASYTINEPPPIEFVLSQIDTPKCTNDKSDFSVVLATGGTGLPFEWTIDNGAPNRVGNSVPLFSGTYKLTVYDKNGCTKDSIITVPDPIGNIDLDFGIDIDTIQLGDSIRLIGIITGQALIDSFLWNPKDFVSDLSSSDSYVKPPVTTTFMLTVVDENGCRATDKVQIVVENIRRFYAPNIISANGDNSNDVLEFTVGPDVERIDLVEVYDRWGNRLYHIENPAITNGSVRTWNGRSRDEPVNPGVFVFLAKVRFRDGFVLVYRGDITVVR